MRKRLRIAIVGYGTGGQASARAMSPQLGQGVNMALLDAHALRDAPRIGDLKQKHGTRCKVLAYWFGWGRIT